MILDDLLKNIDHILNLLNHNKLNAYALTQTRLHEVDVSADQLYRKTYSGFYRLRLPIAEAYNIYFSLIEQHKAGANVHLAFILNELQFATGRIETSFGSKLLATINPNVAPLDSIVLDHLGLALPTYNKPNRMQLCINIHGQLVEQMNALVLLGQFQLLKSAFSVRYPNYEFTDIKILDLLLWKFRK